MPSVPASTIVLRALRALVISLCAFTTITAAGADNGTPEAAGATPDERNTISVVKRVAPSVVAVLVTVEGQRVDPLQNVPPELRQFFQHLVPDYRPGQPQTYVERAAGSGFVVDDNGQIITNFHVIADALQPGSVKLKPHASITVTFADTSQEHPVRVIGADQSYDLALLQLEDQGARPAAARAIPLADSDKLAVGQKAIAIGNPFTLQSTVTTGIVSALNRRQPAAVSGVPINYVQTDAAINPGNSGGPLLDSAGELIGVNDAILAPNGTFIGVGFAIPSNLLQERLPALRTGGYLKKAQLGVQLLDISSYPAEVRQLLKLPESGAMVVAVAPGSPADKAGLHAAQYAVTAGGNEWPADGDVIVEVDGKPLTGADMLQDIVYARDTGDKVRITYVRDGKRRRAELELAVLADTGPAGPEN